MTLSTDKDKYGISLRAEPDHMVLGKRMKAAFKSITASIKELKSEQLEIFQKTGRKGGGRAVKICLLNVLPNPPALLFFLYRRRRMDVPLIAASKIYIYIYIFLLFVY